MKTTDRKMPYVVPEGYFSELEERLGAIPRRNVAVSRFDKLKPFVALAAAFLIIVTCGTALLRFTSGQAADKHLRRRMPDKFLQAFPRQARILR